MTAKPTTREEYVKRFGNEPAEGATGYCIISGDRRTVLEEYYFTDDEADRALSFVSSAQVAELKRMFEL